MAKYLKASKALLLKRKNDEITDNIYEDVHINETSRRREKLPSRTVTESNQTNAN